MTPSRGHDDHFSATSKARSRLARRQSLIGAAGIAGSAFALARAPLALFGSDTPAAQAASCVLTPAKTEGPYFVDELLERTDIRADSDGTNAQEGVPLTLALNVVNEDDGCSVGEGVVVDIWHCNAGGDYSDIAGGTQDNTVGHDWLRGYQITDSAGRARFTTIYPGWYEGRTVHIHFKVRAFDGDSTTYEFTSQLFFDQSFNNAVEASSGYEGVKSTTNASDSIYGNDTEVLVPLSGSVAEGYDGEITIGLTGLPSNSDDPNGAEDGSGSSSDEVEAKLIGVRIKSDHHGRRSAVAKFDVGERVAVRLRLGRNGKALAKAKGTVSTGRHRVSLRIPGHVDAGSATLQAVLEDRAGNVRTIRRKIHVPRRRG